MVDGYPLERTMSDQTQHADRLLRMAVNRLPEAVIIYDTDDRVAFVNEAYRKFFPHMPSVEDLLGRRFEDVIRYSMDTPGVVLDPLARSDPHGYIEKRRRRLHHPQANPFEQLTGGRWHLVREFRVPGVGFFSLRSDITEIKQREIELKLTRDHLSRQAQQLAEARELAVSARETAIAARLEAERANRAKSDFLARVSHELRTPLNAILGFAEIIRDRLLGPSATDRYAEYAADIHGAGHHLLKLIDDILDMAKIEAGRLELAIDWFDARSLFRDLLHTCRPLAARNDNLVLADLAPDLGVINGDVTRVRQVLLNLLSNACKFTRGGEIRITARRIGADDGGDPASPGGWIEIVIADTGIGMTEAQLARVFDDFVQADATISRAYGGTGLGLAICRRLCDAMGGDIRLTSAVGFGTSAILRLPVDIARTAPSPDMGSGAY